MMRRMEVVGYDANGDPVYIGAAAPRPVGLPAGGYAPQPQVQMTPEQAAAILAQHGIMLPGQLPQLLGVQNYLPPANGGNGAPAVYGGNPDWRNGAVAPGVQAAQEGMVPLPLAPSNGTGIYAAGTTPITFTGQLQKPYRAERLLTNVVRNGATANGAVLGQIYVGADLQQADITPIALEAIGNPSSFGTRLTLMQAPPGVLIRILSSLQSAPTGSDTVSVSLMFTGRVIH